MLFSFDGDRFAILQTFSTETRTNVQLFPETPPLIAGMKTDGAFRNVLSASAFEGCQLLLSQISLYLEKPFHF